MSRRQSRQLPWRHGAMRLSLEHHDLADPELGAAESLIRSMILGHANGLSAASPRSRAAWASLRGLTLLIADPSDDKATQPERRPQRAMIQMYHVRNAWARQSPSARLARRTLKGGRWRAPRRTKYRRHIRNDAPMTTVIAPQLSPPEPPGREHTRRPESFYSLLHLGLPLPESRSSAQCCRRELSPAAMPEGGRLLS